MRLAAAAPFIGCSSKEEASGFIPGIQLYTLRRVMGERPKETIEALAAIGFREAEVTQGQLGTIGGELRRLGIQPVSGHWSLPVFTDSSELAAAISEAREHGLRYMVIPYVAAADRGGLDVYRRLAEQINRAGAQCREAGLRLCYHHHAFEFEPMEDGVRPFDVLLNETDPASMAVELDVYWVSVAGLDPVVLLNQLRDRVALMHLKDAAPETPQMYSEAVPRDTFWEVGSGRLDFRAILAAARSVGVDKYFIEQDETPGDPVESVRKSFEYLRGM